MKTKGISLFRFKKGYLIYFCVSLLFTAIQVFPQNKKFRFEKFTSDQGLSQNSVVKIFQDRKQFLWFGTYDGLNRYDGYTFKVYKSILTDSTTISGQYFSSICEDKEGNLWIASLGGGLNKYLSSSDTFKRYKHNPKNPKSISDDKVRAVLIDKSGRLWVGTEYGLDLFDPKTEEFTHFRNDPGNPKSLSNNYVISLGEDAKHNIWVGTFYGLNVFDPIKKTFRNFIGETGLQKGLISNWTNKVFLDSHNNLWLATTGGLQKYDDINDRFEIFLPQFSTPGVNSDNTVRDVIEDKNGNIWIATWTHGIGILDQNTKKFSMINHDPSDFFSLSTDLTISLCQDKSGLMWIGTDGSGINKLNLRKSQFNNFQNLILDKTSLSENKIYSIYEDKKGIIWIGTYGGGINRFDPSKDSKHFTRIMNRPGDFTGIITNQVRWITSDKNGIFWIATDGGLERYDQSTKKFTHYTLGNSPGLRTNAVFCVTEARNGELLVGTYDGGLSVFNKEKNTFTNYSYNINNEKSISSNVIRQVLEDRSGLIWVCTDRGLNLFDPVKKEFTRFLHEDSNPNSISINTLFTIFQDKAGTLWIGTALGLNKLEGDFKENKNIKFTCYTKSEGLPDNDVQSILEDDHGNLWLSTNKGISKFNPSTNTFKNYNKSDGLPSNEFFINSACKRTKTGEFLFGSDKGFCMFHPDSVKDDLFIPPIVFTDFQLFNKPVPINEKINNEIILKQSIWDTKEINLSYENNIIALTFSALNFAAPDANNYAYKLDGLESDWNFVGNRHYASYTNLPPGEYVFRVKGANSSGIWNNEDTALKIIVKPPYWGTWWFRTSAILSIILIAFFLYRSKVKSMEERRINLELSIKEKSQLNEELKKLNDTKDKFFSILAHDLRNPFHSILGMISFIIDEYNTISDPERIDMLNMILNASKNNFHLLDNLLDWSRSQLQDFKTAPKRIDFSELISKNVNLLTPQAEDKYISLESQLEPQLFIYADYYMIDLIVRNLINNAIKFTQQKGTIRIYSRIIENNAQFQITDSGIGMSQEQIKEILSGEDYVSTKGTEGEKGTGLGLKLCKEFIEKNKGKISVQSKLGNGTTFYFEVPIFDPAIHIDYESEKE